MSGGSYHTIKHYWTQVHKLILQDVNEEVEQIHKAMGSRVDVSFDCAGFDKTMTTALNATHAGGTVCLVGMGHTVMTIPLMPAAATRYNS